MKLYDYLMLKEHTQIYTLIKEGSLITTLDNGETYYMLYSLSTFFVEFEYEKFTKKPLGRAIFQSGIQIEKYLPNSKVLI